LKLTPRSDEPISRTLCLTENCILERDPATYGDHLLILLFLLLFFFNFVNLKLNLKLRNCYSKTSCRCICID